MAGFPAYAESPGFRCFGNSAEHEGSAPYGDMDCNHGLAEAGGYPKPGPFAYVGTTANHSDQRGRRLGGVKGPGRDPWQAGAAGAG